MSKEEALTEQQVAARGRALDSAPWQLPKKFRLQSELLSLPPEELKQRDPEMFKLWEAVQADEKRLAAAAAMPMGQMSSQDVYRARAAQRAEEHRRTIHHLDQEIGQALTSGEGNLEELRSAKLAVRHRRAEQLALLGRYDLAAIEEPDPQLRDHYLAILDAVWRPDEGEGSHCGCPPIRGSGANANITVPSWNQHAEIFSIKTGHIVTLMKCSRCGFLNAIDPPAHVLKQRADRAEAARLVGDMSPQDAAATLAAKGHTTKKLIIS